MPTPIEVIARINREVAVTHLVNVLTELANLGLTALKDQLARKEAARAAGNHPGRTGRSR